MWQYNARHSVSECGETCPTNMLGSSHMVLWGMCSGAPPTASTSESYLDPKYFWKMAGAPAHLEQGRPMSVPRHVSVMLSP